MLWGCSYVHINQKVFPLREQKAHNVSTECTTVIYTLARVSVTEKSAALLSGCVCTRQRGMKAGEAELLHIWEHSTV